MNKQGQTVQGNTITGSFECTPFAENQINFFKACIVSLTAQYINKDECLVRIGKDKEEVKEEAKQTEEIKEQPDSKAVE